MSDSKVILLPVAYLAPVSYYASLINCNDVIIEKKETYLKQTIRNRCCIMTANGTLNLTVPVSKPNGNHSRTEDIEIFNNEKWYLMHWRAIESAYSASPYFLYYKDEFEDYYKGNYENLLDFNLKLMKHVMRIIGLSTVVKESETFIKPGELSDKNIVDMRYTGKDIKPDNIYFPPYTQVFSDRYGFAKDLSIIDLLFNLGPESLNYLERLMLRM